MSQLVTHAIEDESYVIPSKYRLDAVIGKGAYGHVCCCTDSATGETLAIKKNCNAFRKHSIIPIRILREVKMLCHFQHPNIIGLRELVQPSDYETFTDVYMIMEYMPLDLRDVLKTREQLSPAHNMTIMYQILLGLQYLHSAGCSHRDLKPENILINEDCEVKLCDFGLARSMCLEDFQMSTNYVQTRWYRAPELILDGDVITTKIDVWSAGCIMAELLKGRVLFKGSSPFDQMQRILRFMGTSSLEGMSSPAALTFMNNFPMYEGVPFKKLFEGVDEAAIDLISKMLVIDPTKRISSEDALRHPFFSSIFLEEDIVQAPKFDVAFETRCGESVKRIKQECYRTIQQWKRTDVPSALDKIEL
jgi:serine/threonine protein kinase